MGGVGDTAMVAGGEVEIVAIKPDRKSRRRRSDVLVLSSRWPILSVRSGMNGDSQRMRRKEARLQSDRVSAS